MAVFLGVERLGEETGLAKLLLNVWCKTPK